MYAAQLRSKDEILAIRAAEREYAKRVLLAQETLKVVREELATCYRENGVNHKMACKGLREEYAKLIQDPTHGAGYPVGLHGAGDICSGGMIGCWSERHT
ncbi:hypothetical protein AM587_10010115 [Phytophthora nicotianae]|uniref:Uncharacterized protein n=1 Tax=Phytophthora nicotianae TaxID=4792 RepID=A0A0W8C600_PHYNI|nr:hypothetical protein AM587_10010115 [Phytophthora nicotianae]